MKQLSDYFYSFTFPYTLPQTTLLSHRRSRVVVERGEEQVRGERLVERRDERVHVLDAAAPTRRLGRPRLGRTGAVPSLRLGPLRVRGEVAEIGRPRVERGVLAVVLPVGLVRHLDVERVVPHGGWSGERYAH